MKCTTCGKELTFVRRFLVMDVGVAHPLEANGDVRLQCTISGEELSREHDDGSFGVWYECPYCEVLIETDNKRGLNFWDSDGHTQEHNL